MKGISQSFAAVNARTTPANELRSVRAIPEYPIDFACSTNSCGCEAPSRNEKFDFVCSSTNLGVDNVGQEKESENVQQFQLTNNSIPVCMTKFYAPASIQSGVLPR